MQVLGKVDAGFTQWRGTMLSVSLTTGFMIFLNLDLFQPGACLVFAGHLKGRREVGLPPSGDLQEAALPVHAQPCHCQEVPLPGESRTEGKLGEEIKDFLSQGFTPLTEEGRRGKQLEEEKAKNQRQENA